MREVAVTGIRHPLADAIGDGWVVTESRAPTVFVTAGLVNLLAEANAAGSRVVLVTDDRSSLTPALDQVWQDAGAGWAVREADGGIRDGYTGRRLQAVTDVFTLLPPQNADQVSLEYLAPEPADSIEVDVTLSLRHRARATTLLGSVVEGLGKFVGDAPAAWGAHEPVGNAWNRDDLTALARAEMPADSMFIAKSAGLAALVSASRTNQGVEEITQARLSLGTPSTLEFEKRRVDLLGYLADLAASAMPLVGIVLGRPARRDLLVRPRMQHPPSAIALLIGAPGVKSLELSPAHMTSEFGAQVVGRPRIPALLFQLGTLGEVDGWTRLSAILASIGEDRLSEALGDDAGLLASSVKRVIGSIVLAAVACAACVGVGFVGKILSAQPATDPNTGLPVTPTATSSPSTTQAPAPQTLTPSGIPIPSEKP